MFEASLGYKKRCLSVGAGGVHSLTLAGLGVSRHRLHADPPEPLDLYSAQNCSVSNCIISGKELATIQMNVAKVDKITGRFNDQLKTRAICVEVVGVCVCVCVFVGLGCQMRLFSDWRRLINSLEEIFTRGNQGISVMNSEKRNQPNKTGSRMLAPVRCLRG